MIYNPNYQSRHSLELHARRSVQISEPVAETEVVEYFDVDTEMKWYLLDAVSPLNYDKRGSYNKVSTRKPVIQMDLNGRHITTHPSVRAAAEKLNADASSIIKCAKGRKSCNHVAGFKWAYQTASE